MIKGVVFDLDGTLLNTIAGIQKSVNRVLQKYGFPEHTESFYKAIVGHGMKSLVIESIPDTHANDIEEILENVKNEYDGLWQTGTTIYQGIPEILTFLEKRNIPMAILSNKPIKYVVESVDSFFDQWTFYPVIGEKYDVPKKPNPYGLELIAQKLHVPARDVLMIGDSAIDIETAIAANTQHAGALWGFKDRAELVSAGAQHLLSYPGQLFVLLGDNHEACSIT
ncbi:MAG: HAD family hydrolase [Candidatus Marinimicrobia bacterium]|nr:HAD family hydrolase [Candidatus Neomarinimicrobiota bacterium]